MAYPNTGVASYLGWAMPRPAGHPGLRGDHGRRVPGYSTSDTSRPDLWNRNLDPAGVHGGRRVPWVRNEASGARGGGGGEGDPRRFGRRRAADLPLPYVWGRAGLGRHASYETGGRGEG